MPRFTGRIEATINDEFEVEADSEEEAREMALEEWIFVEVEDIEVVRIREEDDE